ncbi:MAG: TRAP transporter small permease subunit [Pseudohongiellaceae bacterium]
MLDKVCSVIDRTNHLLGRGVAWLALAMVLLMAAIVVLRYFFQFGSIAMQEAVMYLNALLFAAGAGYTLKEQGHVRVDIFYSRLTSRQQAWIELVGGVLFLLPMTLFILVTSWDYVALSWRIREGSIESSGLPFVYLLKSMIPLLAALLALQGIAEMLKAIRVLRAGPAS